MGRVYLVGILWLLLISAANADPKSDNPQLESMLTEQRISYCADFVHNAKLLIPQLFERDQLDSITLVIDFVRARCSDNLFSDLVDLLAVHNGTFDRNLCDSTLLNQVIWSRRWTGFFPGCIILDYPPEPPDSFEDFLDRLGEELLAAHPEYSDERFIILFHTGQATQILEELSDGRYAGTCMQDAYDARVADVLSRQYHTRGNYYGLLGAWSGLGANKLLGVKPELGFGLGLRRDRFGVDLVLMFRFLKSRETYETRHQGEIKSTDQYFGGFIGLEGTYEALRLGNHQLELVGAAGYEGFDSIDDDDDPKTLGMLGLAWGINYRLFYNRPSSRYVGLQIRHTLTEVDNSPGTDLSGKAISVLLVYGAMPSPNTDWELERLNYYRK